MKGQDRPGKAAGRVPKHLRPPTRAWYEQTLRDFLLEEHHRRLLLLAAEAWDRCEQAREALAAHGLTFTNRFGEVRARPECAIERDNRVIFARMLRELQLDVEAPADESRPPALRGRTGLRAVPS